MLKDLRREKLIELVSRSRDEKYLGVSATELVDEFLGEEAARVSASLEKLTTRERQVVMALVGGASTKDIAAAHGLTISTVNTYMKRVFAKLEVHSRIELVARVNAG